VKDVHDRLERLVGTSPRSDAHSVFERAFLHAKHIRRTRTQRKLAAFSSVVAIIAVTAVVAINGQSDRHGLSIEATATSTTTPSRRPTQYQVDAMIEQSKPAAPTLCIRPAYVASALTAVLPAPQPQPPTCSGPPIRGWDWTQLDGTHTSGKSIWGDYRVVGTYDGRTFTLTRKAAPTRLNGAPRYVTVKNPCPTPTGGWLVNNPSRFSLDDLKAMNAAALSQPDYAGMWTDTTTPVNGRLNLFPEQVLTFAFTGSPTQHRAQLTALWGGPLCVIQHAHTRRELDQIVTALEGPTGQRLGLQVIQATQDEIHGRVNVTTITVTPTMQHALDNRYGSGAVRLTPTLVPVG
jgi:hypothetical protein